MWCDPGRKKTMSSIGEAQPEPGKFTEATLLLEAWRCKVEKYWEVWGSWNTCWMWEGGEKCS